MNNDLTFNLSGQPGRSLADRLAEQVSVKDFGAVGDGTTDDHQAFNDAIHNDAFNETIYAKGSRIVRVPPGEYYLSKPLQIKSTVKLVGPFTGMRGGQAVRLVFEKNILAGIIIHRHDTIDGIVEDPATRSGYGSEISGLYLTQRAGGVQGHGIWLRGAATIKDVMIQGFAENGVHMACSVEAAGALRGNANLWRIDRVACLQNGLHGIFCQGGDVNAGLGTMLDIEGNGGWGVYDSSFLGNTWVACHAATNTLGSYKADNLNARSVFIGCYEEGDQPPNSVVGPSMVVGGLMAAGNNPAIRALASPNILLATPGIVTQSAAGARTVTATIGSLYPGEALRMEITGDGDGGWTHQWEESTGTWRLNHRRLDARVAYRLTTDLAPMGAGHIVFPGPFIGPGSYARQHTSSIVAPVSGAHTAGDIVWNAEPTAGSFAGWICTTAGSPGTWKTFGAISA